MNFQGESMHRQFGFLYFLREGAPGRVLISLRYSEKVTKSISTSVWCSLALFQENTVSSCKYHI